MNSVLLIDDDPDIIKLNKKYLTTKGYCVYAADCGERAMQLLSRYTPDCIVLDVLLPDVLGVDLCEKIRGVCKVPIIFLSCRDNVDDKISWLLSGGDDYITKPFSMRELEARIGAQIRRSGEISIDENNRIVFYRSKNALLSQTEFGLFRILYENKNSLISSDNLYSAIKESGRDSSNTIAVYIRRLRKKLEIFDEAYSIETVRGSGYGLFEK